MSAGRILVTGAPGNVGTPLVSELLERGASVRVAAWDADAARAAFGDSVEAVPFDYADEATYVAFDGVEAMFLLRRLVGRPPIDFRRFAEDHAAALATNRLVGQRATSYHAAHR